MPNKIQAPKKSLTYLICDKLGLKLDSDDFYIVYGYTLSYLTKGITAFEYQKLIKPFCVELSAKVFRLKLHESRYLGLTLKLFMLRLSLLKSVGVADVKILTQELNLFVVDARRIYFLWKEHSKFRSRLKKSARAAHKFNDTLMDHKGLQAFFATVYPSINKKIRFLTYKKLRFIAKSSNIDLLDLNNELMLKAVQAFYSLVPITFSTEYVCNYLKRAIHNHAMNMIQSATTLKKGRLVNIGKDSHDQDQFKLLVVSENQMRVTAENSETSYDEVYSDGSNNLSRFELEYSVSEILTKIKQRSKKFRFLTILMGKEDLEFTDWLRDKGKLGKSQDNTELQMKISPEDFNKLLSAFLNVSEEKVNVFLLKLKNDLALNSSTDVPKQAVNY